jgi:hypothetical protein
MPVFPTARNSGPGERNPDIFFDIRLAPAIAVNALVKNSLRLIIFFSIYSKDSQQRIKEIFS